MSPRTAVPSTSPCDDCRRIDGCAGGIRKSTLDWNSSIRITEQPRIAVWLVTEANAPDHVAAAGAELAGRPRNRLFRCPRQCVEVERVDQFATVAQICNEPTHQFFHHERVGEDVLVGRVVSHVEHGIAREAGPKTDIRQAAGKRSVSRAVRRWPAHRRSGRKRHLRPHPVLLRCETWRPEPTRAVGF